MSNPGGFMNRSHTHSSDFPVCCIIPPVILRKLAEKGDQQLRDIAFEGMQLSARLRGQREAIGSFAFAAAVPTGQKRRTVYDAQHRSSLPGKLVRSEGGKSSSDVAVNEAYDG